MRWILLLGLCCGCRTQSHIVIEKEFTIQNQPQQASDLRVRVEIILTRP